MDPSRLSQRPPSIAAQLPAAEGPLDFLADLEHPTKGRSIRVFIEALLDPADSAHSAQAKLTIPPEQRVGGESDGSGVATSL